MWCRIVTLLSCIVFTIYAQEISLDVHGEHVCSRTESFHVSVSASFSESYQQVYRTDCWDLFSLFRCTKRRLQYRTKYRQELRTQYRSIRECCSGYMVDVTDRTCHAQCSPRCKRGICALPDVCECDAGYRGDRCDSTCPMGTYGKKCMEKCDCPEKSDCDPVNGNCICPPGFNDDLCKPGANMGSQESQKGFDSRLIGAIVGGPFLILLIALIICFIRRRKRHDERSNVSAMYDNGSYENPQTILTPPVQAESNGTIPSNAVLFTNLPNKEVDSADCMAAIKKRDNFDSGKGFPKKPKTLNSYEVASPWKKADIVAGGNVNQFDGSSADTLKKLKCKGPSFVSKQVSDNPPPYQSEEHQYVDIDDVDIHPKTEYSRFPNNKPLSPPHSPNHLPNMYSNVSNRRSHPVPPPRKDLL